MKTIYQIKLIVIFLVLISSSGLYSQLTPDNIYKEAENSILYVRTFDKDGYIINWGSAVAVSEDGVVYTCFHVYKGCDSITFECSGNIYYNPLIIGADPEKDIIIFKLKNYRNGFIKCSNSDSVNVGENIYAFGNPQGYKKSITNGIINGFRDKEYDFECRTIQFSAPISGGSSGGALLNSKGELIGITASTSTLKSQNINFAIPVNYFKEVKIAEDNDAAQVRLISDFCKGYSYYSSNSYFKAEDYFLNYLKEYPEDISALYYTGLNSKGRGQYDSAIAYMKRITAIDSNNVKAFTELGDLYYFNKDTLAALENYNKAIELDYQNVNAVLRRGTFYEYLTHNNALAVEDYNNAILLKPDYTFIYLYRSRVYLAMEDTEKAINDLYASVNYDLDIAWTCMERAGIFTDLEYFDEAIADYSQAIKLNPYDDSYYSARGICYLKNSDFINAITDFNSAVSLNSRNSTTLSNMAYAYLDLKEYDDAEKWFKRSMLQYDKSFDTYLGLAMVYYQQNEKTKCLNAFNSAVKLERRLKKGMNGIKKLEEDQYFWLNEDKVILNEICKLAGYYYYEEENNNYADKSKALSGKK